MKKRHPRDLLVLISGSRLMATLFVSLPLCLCGFLAMAFHGRGPDGSGQATRATRTVNVPANGDFQSALNSAQPEDTIILEAGSTYTGHFTLPNKPGSEYVTVTTAALSSLPPEGARVNPSFAHYMPKLVSPNDGPTLRAAPGAHHYRLVGIEFHPKERVYQWDVIAIGQGNETSLGALPHDIVFDRVYIHGD